MNEQQIKLEIQHIFDSGVNELRVFEMIERLLKPKPGSLRLELNLQSPYNPDGSPRTDLPTGEVLAWDGNNYHIGFLRKDPKKWGDNENQINCISVDNTVLYNVARFAPLPTIIEQDDLL